MEKVETAQRSPKGVPYSNNQRQTGVEYKNPPPGPGTPREVVEQVYSILNEKGQEIPDPVPLEPPLGWESRPSLADFVQRMIRTTVSQAAEQLEVETFEEADDFDIEDDPLDPLTPYEEVFMPPPKPAENPASQATADKGGGAGEGAVPPTQAPAPATPSPPNEKP